MMARKPIPENIKVLKGTFRKHRVNAEAPKAVDGEMMYPALLPKAGEKYFDFLKAKIEELGLASPSYDVALGLAALCMHHIEMLFIEIQAEGLVIDTMDTKGNETKKANPAYAMLSDARRQLQSLLADFGLNPSAIQKVGAKGGGKKENPFGAFG